MTKVAKQLWREILALMLLIYVSRLTAAIAIYLWLVLCTLKPYFIRFQGEQNQPEAGKCGSTFACNLGKNKSHMPFILELF
ncbi:hypothetical protein [Bacillus mycoides]|uniref:hypothetical protein n=1 Tax=Bacillus mycoides TaxID=1405 RepID=UPI0009946BCD|nr:hypothetical protein [Bacillus mycoides]OOR15772.1 hypothetical protein BW891_24540 [Bacillus mycoides]